MRIAPPKVLVSIGDDNGRALTTDHHCYVFLDPDATITQAHEDPAIAADGGDGTQDGCGKLAMTALAGVSPTR